MTGRNWSMDGDEFQVLVNDEGQHSLWPSAQPVPDGWRREGPIGRREECLEHVDEHWLDLRPASLRRVMAECDSGPGVPRDAAA